jgi:predicted transcriptional regulator of viral defense system
LAELPALPHEDVIAAWVKAGRDRAVVSHETALALYELAPIRPRKIHLTVARAHRPHSDRPQLPAVQIHTTTQPFRTGEVVHRFGVRVTSPARTIVDAADSGTDPSFIVEAAGHALKEGMLIVDELRQAARDRSGRVRKLIDRAIEEAGRHATIR